MAVTKAPNVPTPIQPKSSIDHLRALASNKEIKTNEEPTEEEEGEKTVAGNEVGDTKEKAEVPPKRNLWWLKKKRKRRSRLTYIKAKYRRKDDDGVPSTSEVPPVEEESEADLQSKSLLDRPKRGRPPKGVPFRLPKLESFSNSDPDWDETEERRRVKPAIKKRKGRGKKGELPSCNSSSSPPPHPPRASTIFSGTIVVQFLHRCVVSRRFELGGVQPEGSALR